MRTNNKLAIAIAATIFSFSTTQTVLASGLTNLGTEPSIDVWQDELAAEAITDPTEFLSATSYVSGGSPAEPLGILYATEIFGSASGPFPSTKSAAVEYMIDGAIDEDFYLSFKLSGGATFSSSELFADANAIANIDTIDGPNTDGSSVRFTVSVNDTGDNKIIPAESRFLLKYKLGNVSDALGSSNGKITMTVEPTSVGLTPYLVNVSDETVVARSAQGVTIEIDGDITVDTKIATAAGGTEFSQATPSSDGSGVYITQSQARIGKIIVRHYSNDDPAAEKAFSADGETQFVLGEGKGLVKAATLTITDGQFAAANDPGSVSLDGITAETTVEDDDTTATIDLTDAMGELAGDVAVNPEKSTDILLDLDGVTSVNIPENAPCAILNIDYNEDTIADIDIPSDGCVTLPKIPQDGTTCWVNIVPKPTAATDDLSILITNNTNDEAELTGTMYAQDGTALFTSQILKDSSNTTVLGAGKTMRLTPSDLAMLMDGATADNPGTWTGRSSLKVSTTLSSIEILALMRDSNSNINSNVSQGSIDSKEVLCK